MDDVTIPLPDDEVYETSIAHFGLQGTVDLTIDYLGVPGWVELRHFGAPPPVRTFAKLGRRQDGRTVITRLIVTGDLIDSSVLRTVPLGRAESSLNSRRHNFADPHDEEIDEFIHNIEMYPRDEVAAVDEAVEDLLAKPLSAISTSINRLADQRAEKPRRPPLTRPDGVNPEGFSRRVAEAYNEAVRTTPAPAKVLAEEAGVPVVTVHRWIADARRRGFLPPARRGRAG